MAWAELVSDKGAVVSERQPFSEPEGAHFMYDRPAGYVAGADLYDQQEGGTLLAKLRFANLIPMACPWELRVTSSDPRLANVLGMVK